MRTVTVVLMSVTLAPRSAGVWLVAAGARLRVADPCGGQAGDVVLFDRHDVRVCFSQSRTRVENRTVRPTVGAGLWSGGREPVALASVTALSPKARLDLLYTPCCRWALRKRFMIEREGCWELLERALETHGIASNPLPDPLNIFFGVDVDAHGGMAIVPGASSAGDVFEMRAERDLIVAVSACPAPRADGGESGPLIVDVLT